LYRKLSTHWSDCDAGLVNPEPVAFQSPYTVRPPHWLLCDGREIRVGPSRYDLLEFMQGKPETLTEDAMAVLSPETFHRTKTALNQFLARQGFAFHFRAGRDGKLRLIGRRYEKPTRVGKRHDRRGKRKGE
jgi:hypothetical protein